MGLKRTLLDSLVRACAFVSPNASHAPERPKSIFVLRNNDIGDLLVITPLFQALKETFPDSRITAGIGNWNREILDENPYVDDVLEVDAPWHNARIHPQRPQDALRYIFCSQQAKVIAKRKFSIGIDVLGSGYGSLLMLRAGIPWRLGVSGYAGGDRSVQQMVRFDAAEHVGRASLRFAELLGAQRLPENRPQLFAHEPLPPCDLIFAPGGGLPEKCWPAQYFATLAEKFPSRSITVIGGKNDFETGELIATAGSRVSNLAGKLTLRETFAFIASSRAVICNSSMAMHAAAAFKKPCFVVLGDCFPSAVAHAKQWGYPESVILGREPGFQPDIYTPEEVFQKIEALSA